jgi:hypothetical protein
MFSRTYLAISGAKVALAIVHGEPPPARRFARIPLTSSYPIWGLAVLWCMCAKLSL